MRQAKIVPMEEMKMKNSNIPGFVKCPNCGKQAREGLGIKIHLKNCGGKR